MNLKDLASGALQVLKTIAPTIADTAAGPFAPLVDPLVRSLVGSTDPKQVSTALLNATPEQLTAWKQADDKHAEMLTQLGIDRDKLAFDDTANARQMQMATKDPTVRQIAWLNVGGFLAISIAMLISAFVWPDHIAKVPAAAWAALGPLLGYLAKSAAQTEMFYFGSSAGSQAKDQTLADIAKAA